MDKLFLVDMATGRQLSYDALLRGIQARKYYWEFLQTDDVFEFFTNLIAAVSSNQPITLLDKDFTDGELESLLASKEKLSERSPVDLDFRSLDDMLRAFRDSLAPISVFTSGTTGLPKTVVHTPASFLRSARVDEGYSDNVWGFAYNPAHMAGLQVFFQAFLNLNTIVILFEQSRDSIFEALDCYQITHLSATPTFYRLLRPVESTFESVKRVTFGGEKSSDELYESVKAQFPNGKVNNIYASTEAGAVLNASGDAFSIKKELEGYVKIVDNELVIHRSIMGAFDGENAEGEWYHTGDLVEINSESPFLFKFLSRKTEMINVGGYKVNPNEVEEAINRHPSVQASKVYGRKNSVLGNVLCADVVVQVGHDTDFKYLRDALRESLQDFKIPRVFKSVSEIETTRSGKVKR